MYWLEKLNKILKEKGLSQRKLAEKIGKNYTSVNFLLAGKQKMDIDTFLKICNALEIEPCDIFDCTPRSQVTVEMPDFVDVLFAFYDVLLLNQMANPQKKRIFTWEFWYVLIVYLFTLADYQKMETEMPYYVANYLSLYLDETFNELTKEELNSFYQNKALYKYFDLATKVIEALRSKDEEQLERLREKFLFLLRRHHEILGQKVAAKYYTELENMGLIDENDTEFLTSLFGAVEVEDNFLTRFEDILKKLDEGLKNQ